MKQRRIFPLVENVNILSDAHTYTSDCIHIKAKILFPEQ